ncbi:hypothetical protein OESDEN_07602 [Oesophagostomum dentatum]|uniref:Uncharacterized protein n=1 Tax=Oesophagostomum dentatum TaxID=61180 RepID=A0A0B1T5I7_OESDE|nr:hypothetical protein OESDEN_07602 [Oesophagostomum dentatum]
MVEMQPNIEAQAKERQHSLDMDFKSLRDGFIHNDGDVCIQIDPTMSRRYVRTCECLY